MSRSERKHNWGALNHYGKWAEGYEPEWYEEWRKGEVERQKVYRARRKFEERREVREWVRQTYLDGAEIDLVSAHALLSDSGQRIGKRGICWLAHRLTELGIAYKYHAVKRLPEWKRDMVAWFEARVIERSGHEIPLKELCHLANVWIRSEFDRPGMATAKGMGMLLRAKGVQIKRDASGMLSVGIDVGDKLRPVTVAKPVDDGLI